MALEAPFITREDGTRSKKAGELVYEGSAVTIDANGELALAADSDKVYGISKLDSNNFRDFAFGEFGAFGSGQLTVITSGIVKIKASVFNQTEVDSSTTTASAPTTVALLDTAALGAASPGAAIYVDDAGLLSSTAGTSKLSLMGKMLSYDATAGELEMELLPMPSTKQSEIEA